MLNVFQQTMFILTGVKTNIVNVTYILCAKMTLHSTIGTTLQSKNKCFSNQLKSPS